MNDLRGSWGKAVLIVVVYMVVVAGAGVIGLSTAGILSLIVSGPMAYGFYFWFYQLSRGNNPTIEDLFAGFKAIAQAIIISILMGLYIALWTLLFIVPGIIMAISYSMTYYVAIDNPELSASECLAQSAEMMDGHKMEYFMLSLSLIGWAILSILSLGIGVFWFIAYAQAVTTNFYKELKLERAPAPRESRYDYLEEEN